MNFRLVTYCSGLAPAAALLLLAGCQREAISVYRIPKETKHVVVVKTPSAARMDRVRPEIRWSSLPSGWKETPPTSMRVANFIVEEAGGQKAAISVTPLVGAVGIEAASVNNWRGEVGLNAAETTENVGLKVQVGETQGTLYDFSGSRDGEKARIIGAVLQREGVTWFFKMLGSDSLVAQQKSAFVDFLKGVSFVEGSLAMAANSQSAGDGHDHSDDSPTRPAWEVPDHWQEQGAKAMVLATFAISSDSGKAEVAVSAFAGEVGGLTANVNRWRGIMGLAPVPASEVSKFTSAFEVKGEAGTLVDMTNEAKGIRTTVVVLPHAGMTWFFKLTGPDALVAKEKPVFIKFVQSVRFPGNA